MKITLVFTFYRRAATKDTKENSVRLESHSDALKAEVKMRKGQIGHAIKDSGMASP